MAHTRKNNIFLLLAVLSGLLLATPAFAYVDPNATGLIAQIVGPVLLVAATGLTFLRKQILATFQRLTGRDIPKK